MNFFLFSLLSLATSCLSQKNDERAEQPVIRLSTNTSVPLNKQIHSGCTVDIFFGKRFQPREVLADPYFTFLNELHFTSLQYSGGSTSDYDHVIVGDTLISGGQGNGYNIREEDLTARGQNMEAALDGVGAIDFGKDFFNEYQVLLHRLGLRGDVIANVQSGTIAEMLWKIERTRAQRVILGMEQNLSSNEKDFPDGNAYRIKIEEWISAVKAHYPEVKIVLDAAPVFNPKPRFVQWNQQIADLPGDEVRLYLWDRDLAEWSGDQEKNITLMDEVFSSTIPGWINKADNDFPGKKIAVCQWGIKNKSPLMNTLAGCFFIAKFYEFAIHYNRDHENAIGYASFMSIKSLNRGDGSILNHALALKAIGQLFTGQPMVHEISLTGLRGVGGVAISENGKWKVLLLNPTGNSYQNLAIMLDASEVAGQSFQQTVVSAASLSSTDVSYQSETAKEINVKPYSISVFEF